MFHVKFVHYMLKKRQLARRPLMCPRLFFLLESRFLGFSSRFQSF
jgi:hypothetical protein